MGFANVCDVQLQKPDIRFPLSPSHKHLLVLMFSSPMRCFCWYFSFNNNTIACFHIWSYAMSESEEKKTSPENLEMSLNWVFERTTQRKNYFWSDRSINDNLLCWCLNLRNWLSQPETFAKHFLKQSYKGFLNRACATLFISTFCCKSKISAFMSQLFEKLFIAENYHPIWSNICSRWCLWKW